MTYGFEFICWTLENVKTAALLPVPVALSYIYLSSHSLLWFPLVYVLVAVMPAILFVLWLVASSQFHDPGRSDWTSFIDVQDEYILRNFRGEKIPIETFVEAYLKDKVQLKKDLLEILLNRNKIFRFNLTISHVEFFFKTFLQQLSGHSKVDDHKEVGDVYNRGNDFYNWFLGETMIYTSGMWHEEDDNLKSSQYRKLDTVAKYIHLEAGEEHLDIGCGWGTLICHFADKYGSKSTGCTLAKEQVAWGQETAKKLNVKDKVNFLCCDYREIPERTNGKKFNKITCLEMAEHVGIKNFQTFLQQVKSMLADDGIFYLQIAGLRRAWQWEDLIWGLFMGRYIFPGADASCPLGFVVNQLERAGFEVHRVENMGVHYSKTIQAWYENWKGNEDAIVGKYGKRWFRLWMVFLSWSTIIARQGSSTVFMITCNKNLKNDFSSVADPVADRAPFNRLKMWVGPKAIASQQ